jgi:hypothetical protein
MPCDLKTNINKKSCDSYIKGGMCSKGNMFRCTEYIERNEPILSHSAIMNFIRCHRLHYYNNIQGIQLKDSEYSDPLRIGIAVDDYITVQLLTGEISDSSLTINTEIEYLWQAKSIAIMHAFTRLIDVKKYISLYSGQYKFELDRDGYPHIKGYIDLDSKSGKNFIELKVGKSPEYYLNLFYIKYKLATYFMASDEYKSARVWAIRVPQLKRIGKFKDESLTEYSNRCYRDMLARAPFYFPGYNSKIKNFGTKFGRVEIDIDEMWKYYRMIADNIKLCVKRDLWMQNGGGCLYPFECDYLPICKNNGAISEDVYTFRKVK